LGVYLVLGEAMGLPFADLLCPSDRIRYASICVTASDSALWVGRWSGALPQTRTELPESSDRQSGAWFLRTRTEPPERGACQSERSLQRQARTELPEGGARRSVA
jgi:hypothetical protein